jgi:hypothetical protein
MSSVFVKVDANWADEFDIDGFIVAKKDEWDKSVEKLKKDFPSEQEIYFGTNEYIEFADIEDFESSLEVTEITDVEAEVLNKLFNTYGRKTWFSYGLGGSVASRVFDIATEGGDND